MRGQHRIEGSFRLFVDAIWGGAAGEHNRAALDAKVLRRGSCHFGFDFLGSLMNQEIDIKNK